MGKCSFFGSEYSAGCSVAIVFAQWEANANARNNVGVVVEVGYSYLRNNSWAF
jgi:hypothetical protein